MALNLSMKGRLLSLAGLALLGMATLAAVATVSSRINQAALEKLYTQDIQSVVRLQRIENSLLEVRFRAAGVLLEQLPVPGSLNHLREIRKSVAALWSELEPKAGQAFGEAEAAETFAQLSKNWGQVDATLAKLELGYTTKNNAALTAVLEEDWATLHKLAVKPLQALIPITQRTAAASYQQAVAQSQRLLVVGLVAGLLCMGGLTLVVVLTLRALLQPLRSVAQAMNRIADGDLSATMPAERTDELGQVLIALTHMQDRLRSLVTDVSRTADNITIASSEIATGNLDLSHRTELAASHLQQTAGSLEQLTATVRQSADAAAQANQLATSASSVAQRGGAVVSQVVRTMDEINHSSKRIADIIGTIDGIAFQTNILALNAAVEAARAGEQGRGFAVVASEVRSLAQRSAAAAREIKTLIGTSVDKVEAGARLVQDAGTTMGEIVTSVRRVSDVIAEITAAASEQSSGIGQVNGAVSSLDQMTQQNAALVEESAAAAKSMRDQAQRLSQAMRVFRLTVPATQGGSACAATALVAEAAAPDH